MPPVTKVAAQVIIRRPDGTETRLVRRKPGPVQTRTDSDAVKRDEDREAVLACPPYTASFNTLLKERREKNSRVLVNAVLERMHAEAIPLNVVTYNLLMERVVCFPDDVIFTLYEEIKEEAVKDNSSVRPNLTTYQLLFRACERKGEYNRAFLLYKQLRELMHITPDSPTYDTLLGFCAAVRDVAQATYFVEEMRNNGVTPDVNTYNCLMSVLVDSAPYEETLGVFQQMIEEGIKPTIRTYNTVCKAARAHGDYDRAFQLFEEMKKRGMLPDVVTYNTLLSMAEHRLDYIMGQGNHEHVRRSFEQRRQGKRAVAGLTLTLLAEMESIKLKPNTFTFNQVMAALLKCGDHRVFNVYRTMQTRYAEQKSALELQAKRRAKKKRTMLLLESDTPSNTEAWSSSTTTAAPASTASAENADGLGAEQPMSLDEAMDVEDPHRPARIAAQQSRPNRDTYRLIVRACLELGLADKCDHFYREMRREGLGLDHDFAVLMEEVCEATGDRVRARSVLDEAKGDRLLIDTTLFNAYLSVLASLGDAEVMHIVEEMQLGINVFNVRPDVATFNRVLRSQLCMGNHEKVADVFASMYLSYSQVTPDTETYCWVLRSYCQTHDTEAATQLLESMKQRKVPVSVEHYHHLMLVYLEADDARIIDVFHLLRNATGDEALPKADTQCFCALLQYYLRQQQWDELEGLFLALKADPVLEVDTGCYNVILEMCLRQKRVEYAEKLFNELRMKCVPADITMYNTLLRLFASVGNKMMYSVLEEMKANHVAPAATTLGILLEYAEGRQAVSTAVEHGLFWNPADDLEGLI
ncbi:hypothetical protein DQ04_01211020 [Trypanosoma grayi]|uniref:hypothetical protein n=1 Tax=Trypanosoma grayi TaxID=71804 RepID=UPI0004F4B0C9|nr:hypothetical protein DQ04_01211020 [Trypanosoma grayi]KEG13103.1 hypothetical protein DQ04_01211020 [Trypanosoma grayi]